LLRFIPFFCFLNSLEISSLFRNFLPLSSLFLFPYSNLF
jgi:hypothetical protein